MGILNLPYEENTEFYDNEVQNFLIRFGQVYVFMFFISIVLSYFLSSYITKSLKIISDKIQQTQLDQRNEKIVKIEDFKVSYEQAESDATANFNHKFVVEKAVVADRKEKPKRMILVLVATVGGFLFGLFFLLIRQRIRELQQNVA